MQIGQVDFLVDLRLITNQLEYLLVHKNTNTQYCTAFSFNAFGRMLNCSNYLLINRFGRVFIHKSFLFFHKNEKKIKYFLPVYDWWTCNTYLIFQNCAIIAFSAFEVHLLFSHALWHLKELKRKITISGIQHCKKIYVIYW